MAYRIEISPLAFDDVNAVVAYIGRDSLENAYRWRTQLFAQIEKLDLLPRSCSLAPESEYCSIEVRQFIFGRYRVLFTIRDEDSLVYVLTIRHGARRFMTAEEVDPIE